MSVYKIVQDGTKCLYVGSSQNIARRITKHYSDCYNINERSYNKPLYKYLREVSPHGWPLNVKIIVVYHQDDYFKEDLLYNEDSYIVKLKPLYNVRYATTTEQERADYMKDYKQKNKAIINEKKKKKVECHICKVVYTTSNKSRHDKTKFHISKME